MITCTITKRLNRSREQDTENDIEIIKCVKKRDVEPKEYCEYKTINVISIDTRECDSEQANSYVDHKDIDYGNDDEEQEQREKQLRLDQIRERVTLANLEWSKLLNRKVKVATHDKSVKFYENTKTTESPIA